MILNPFDENIVAVAKLPVQTHNRLVELSADKTLQLEFSSQDLNKFRFTRSNEYKSLARSIENIDSVRYFLFM